MGPEVARGPEAHGGKPARELGGPNPEALGTEPAPSPWTLPPLGCREQGGHAGLFFEPGARLQAPPLSGAGAWRRPGPGGFTLGAGWAIRGLPSGGPGVRGPGTPTARARDLEPAQRGRVRARPAYRAAPAAAAESAGGFVRPFPAPPLPRFPRASFGGGAAR